MNQQQIDDRDDVWAQIALRHPEFTRTMDQTNNYHAVREIVLGGSMAWAGVHERFKPAPGKLVMDIGANTGIFTAFCAANGAEVVAYEPFAIPCNALRNMVDATCLGSLITVKNEAVWKFDGIVPYIGNISVLADSCPAFNGGLPVTGVYLNEGDLARAHQTDCVTLATALGDRIWDCVKMDIEGAEFEVIASTPAAALRRIRFMYLELHPWANFQLYADVLAKLQSVFDFDGAYFNNDLGRWEAIYLTGRS